MARINIYLPDEMAEVARSAKLNVSALTQNAIRIAVGQQSTNEWLANLEVASPAVGSSRD